MTAEQSGLAVSRRAFLQGLGLTTAATAAHHLIAHADEPAPPPPLAEPHAPLSAPSAAVVALNRMAFGPRPGDVAAFNALGATDEERTAAYVEQQLNPIPAEDTELNGRLAAIGFQTLAKTQTEMWVDHYRNPSAGDYVWQTLPIRETERATFVRALYSKWQLAEVMADFWHNHFNIYGWDFPLRSFFVQYDRDVIRAHLFGNFRQMLEAVAKSPAMLFYLDNESSTRAGPNENWARELFELHGLGAENYKGVRPQNSIAPDPDDPAFPLGYVDEDVYEATRCFTGWTVNYRVADGDTGEFIYLDANHDRFQKSVLNFGQINFPSDQAPLQDGLAVLDLIANHPGTARYICRKLCIRLIADTPPDSLVQSAAQIFRAQREAPDQIKQVLRHILNSAEFRSIWGEKVKRPFEALVAAMRAGNADWNVDFGTDSNSLVNQYNQMGQPLFSWGPPNGYPDSRTAWESTTPLVMRWRLFNWLVNLRDVNLVYYLPVLDDTPPTVRSANALVDFWTERLLGRAPDSDARQILVNFMAQTSDPDVDLVIVPEDGIHGRLRTLVALILQSPDFNQR
ncbi:MAG: DUF1800 domain-containing protein [Chloroflexi bacterium]|nr:DUF1800 domain-containing protein [Chloroflexota bacterium]